MAVEGTALHLTHIYSPSFSTPSFSICPSRKLKIPPCIRNILLPAVTSSQICTVIAAAVVVVVVPPSVLYNHAAVLVPILFCIYFSSYSMFSVYYCHNPVYSTSIYFYKYSTFTHTSFVNSFHLPQLTSTSRH